MEKIKGNPSCCDFPCRLFGRRAYRNSHELAGCGFRHCDRGDGKFHIVQAGRDGIQELITYDLGLNACSEGGAKRCLIWIKER